MNTRSKMKATAFLGVILFGMTARAEQSNPSWGIVPVKEFECTGGGDVGPTPLRDISGALNSKVSVLKTVGEESEFIPWEQKNRLVYRNLDNWILDLSMTGLGMSRPYFKSAGRLSRVIDINERFLLFEGKSQIYDTKLSRFYSFSIPSTPPDHELRHLFWNEAGDTLYSGVKTFGKNGDESISIYRYTPGDNRAYKICDTGVLPADVQVSLSKEQAYPYVTLVGTSQLTADRSVINLRNIDVQNQWPLCQFQMSSVQNWYVPGQVQSVHTFPHHGGLAVKINNPLKDLLWADPSGCRYFYLGDKKVVVPNPKVPVLFSWSPTGEGTLEYLQSQEKAVVVKTSSGQLPPNVCLSEDDMWLASDAQRLFLNPSVGRDFEKLMLMISLF